MAVSILLALLLLLQFSLFYIEIEVYNSWRTSSEPEIVSEYYKYLLRNPIEGTVLTSDPLVGAYSDNKLLPFYYDVDTAFKICNQNKDEAKAVFYTPRSFPCQDWDQDCIDKKESLFSDINSEFELVFSGEYHDETYYIFEKR